MASTLFDRMRTLLMQKRENLNLWQTSAPPGKKAVLLGPVAEEAVIERLEAIEDSIAKAEDGTLGICTVCMDPIEPELLEVDYTACVCLSHLSKDEIGRLEDELELAKTVQRALLPKQVPSIAGLEMAAFSRPAQFIGGDYFDFVNFQGNKPGLVIADIAGHGISASMQMASIQSLTRAIVPSSLTPSEAVGHIHSLFIHNINFTTFVTFFIGVYDPQTHVYTYCNAGHNPPLLIRPNAGGRPSAIWLNPTGAAVGLIEEASYVDHSLVLQPGDVMVKYTDGLVEAFAADDCMYGVDRLVEVVSSLAGSTPKEIASGIRLSLEEFVLDRALSDDVTFIVCKVME